MMPGDVAYELTAAQCDKCGVVCVVVIDPSGKPVLCDRFSEPRFYRLETPPDEFQERVGVFYGLRWHEQTCEKNQRTVEEMREVAARTIEADAAIPAPLSKDLAARVRKITFHRES